MKRPLTYRLQEWAADHFDAVQYPPMAPPARRLFEFKYAMPWYQRVFIVVISSIIIVICLGVLATLMFGAYIVISA